MKQIIFTTLILLLIAGSGFGQRKSTKIIKRKKPFDVLVVDPPLPTKPLPNESDANLWQDYAVAEHNFVVTFPAANADVFDNKTNSFTNYTAETANARYELLVSDYPNVFDNGELDTVMEDGLKNVYTAQNIRIVSKKDVYFNQKIGKEIISEKNDKITRTRFLVVAQRQYLMSVVWPKAKFDQNFNVWAQKFFDSLRVPKDDDQPFTLPADYKGELKDGVYRNDFLGLTLKLPDGWKAFNADEEAAAQEVGKQMLQKNDAAFNARLEAGENAAKSLLFVSKKAFGLPDNAALTIVLDPRFAALTNRFPLRQSAMATQTFLTKNSNVPLTVARSVYETKLGGLQTFSFELTGKSADGAAFRVTNYLLRRQNCTVIVTATGSSDADNTLLSSILQTLTFTQTK